MSDLEVMIILIEGEYPACKRNTPSKLKALLLDEFDCVVTETQLLHFYGLTEDYERESNKIEYGHNYY